METEINALTRAIEAKAYNRIRAAVRRVVVLVLLASVVGSLLGGWIAAGIAAVAR
jgi:uncharacterized membrane protein YdbT with pleckstrin-like domain